MQSSTTQPTKHPGAPFGNINALKHGLYTRRLKNNDPAALAPTDFKSLSEEVALIRLFTHRLLDRTKETDDPRELVSFLRVLCLASLTITRLIKVQTLLGENDGKRSKAIDEMIQKVMVQWDQEQPSSPPSPEA